MAAPNTYSTVVAWVRVILPLVALGLLSTLFLFSRRPDPSDAIPLAQVDVAALVAEQRLSSPRFSGTLEDGRAIAFAADLARPVPGEAQAFEAENVEARIELGGAEFVFFRAASALVDVGGQVTRLSGEVRADRSDGLSLRTEEVRIGLDRLFVEAPGRIEVEGRGITLEAGAMSLRAAEGEGDADLLRFTGGVRMVYEPGE